MSQLESLNDLHNSGGVDVSDINFDDVRVVGHVGPTLDYEVIYQVDTDGMYTSAGEILTRCKNCKYCHEDKRDTSIGWVDVLVCESEQWSMASLMPSHEVEPDGFCKWGEPREGGEPLAVEDRSRECEEHKREFVGFEIDMLPCCYMHGAKAPYYSIVYREDGEQYKGFSSFSLDTVSGYLRDYFTSSERSKER